MIFTCPSTFFQWRIPARTVCFASATTGINTEQLREQLDLLHKEAEAARVKEKLQRQAAVSVRTGKENDARELLFQKKKVMQAMEKSKNRIQLLDELSVKLNKVISVKENQLIGNVASELEVSREPAPTPVRIVSPKEKQPRNSTENNGVVSNSLQAGQEDDLQLGSEGIDLHNFEGLNSYEDSVGGNAPNKVDVLHSLKEISSYEDFLEHLDWQINKIEDELNLFLSFSSLILENKKLENSKVEQVMEILQDVHRLRARIARMMQKEVETR